MDEYQMLSITPWEKIDRTKTTNDNVENKSKERFNPGL